MFARRNMPELSSTTFEDDDKAVLLGKEENGYYRAVPTSKREKSKLNILTRVYVLVIHALLLYLLLKLWNKSKAVSRDALLDGESWSPIHGFVEYALNSEHSTEHDKHSRYSGEPTPDQDAAWDDLIRPMFFNASIEELQRGGERLENLAAVQGGGYAATIGAYHELHCLRQLRFYVFRDRYYPNLTTAQETYLRGHLEDHCIETLRLSTMCYGNQALVSFAWGGEDAEKPLTQSSSRSVCAKWESIDAWARSRTPQHYALAERTRDDDSTG
ncbi:hypothetical protein GGR50DRAFT_586863 [Xylaria sp. CBS 124048]|nr:hypothetical protein GGR50DRAFT_586863 [Xylaria sp. CBS 124048]